MKLDEFLNLDTTLDRKKRIVILGNYSGDNVGDNAILYTMLHDLTSSEMISHDDTITIPTRFPDKIKSVFPPSTPQVHAAPTSAFFKLIGLLARGNTFVLGGGTIFSQYAGPFVYVVCPFLLLMRLFGKRIYVYSLGYEKSTPLLIRLAITPCFALAHRVSVRDERSRDNLRSVQRFRPIELVPDPVLRITDYLDVPRAKAAQKPYITTVFNAVKQIDTATQITAYADLIEAIAKDNKKMDIHIGVFYEAFDLELNQQLMTALVKRGIARKRMRLITTTDLVSWCSELRHAELVLAQRLHATVLSYVLDACFFALSYQPKCEAFITAHDITQWTDLNEFIDNSQLYTRRIASLITANKDQGGASSG